MILAYLRTSTGFQAKGLDAQKLAIKEYCSQKKLLDVRYFEDEGISGAKESRPGLDELLEICKSGKVKIVICYSFSRISRSTKHLLEILDLFNSQSIHFISLSESVDTTTPFGKCFFTIIASINALERELVSERVKTGMKAAKARGSQIGAPRIINRELIIHLYQQGYKQNEIAKLAKCSEATVSNVVSKYCWHL